MVKKSEISEWAVEYLVHTPCMRIGGGGTSEDVLAVVEYLYEDTDHPDMLTGFRCPECGHTVDLVPREKAGGS